MAPIAVGLVAASGITVATSADHSMPQWALSAIAAAVLSATKVNPVYVMLGGGAAGLWMG
jgi:chromate transporter